MPLETSSFDLEQGQFAGVRQPTPVHRARLHDPGPIAVLLLKT